MSPLIDLQRRLVQVGRIRMGERNEKGFPTRLANWKLTSRDRVRLEAAAQAYGGAVQPWAGHDGEYELHTETDALPILLLPGQTISQHYELWSGGGCKRRCDGETEQLTDGPCLCDRENRECKPHTRVNVLLPDVPGIGCWRFDSTGWNAAEELDGAVALLELAATRGSILPARLRIDQRSKVRDGQTKRFAVPTLDIDVRPLEMMAIANRSVAGEIAPVTFRPELPVGYTPIAPAASADVPNLDESLAKVTAPAAETARSGRSAPPIGPPLVPDEPQPVPVPVPVQDGDEAPGVKPVSDAMRKKLNMLVGQLRDSGHLTTAHVYALANAVTTTSEDGELHWSPLRDSLDRERARALLDRLEAEEQIKSLEEILRGFGEQRGMADEVDRAIRGRPRHLTAEAQAAHIVWVQAQITRAQAKAEVQA